MLQAFLEPMRTRRKEFAQDPQAVIEMLKKGTDKTRVVAAQTMCKVRRAMKIDYFG